MSEIVPTEFEEQVTVVQYLELKGHKFTAIPNSTFTKSWNVKRKNTQSGLRAGLPDLLAIVDGTLIFIEMKRRKGGVLSEAQKGWITELKGAGQIVHVCKGADEAIEKIRQVEKFKPYTCDKCNGLIPTIKDLPYHEFCSINYKE